MRVLFTTAGHRTSAPAAAVSTGDGAARAHGRLRLQFRPRGTASRLRRIPGRAGLADHGAGAGISGDPARPGALRLGQGECLAGTTARQTDPAETAPTHHRLRPASAVLAPEEGERTVAVHAVLEDPKYRSNAQRLRQQTLPGLEHGIRLLERLANENAPHRP
jgi:hypothetical protein